jgi:hypothetical protein
MRRIIPFAFAVIVVLAGGIYLFSSKIIKSPVSPPQTTGKTEDTTQSDTSKIDMTTETVSPTKSAAVVNQIALSVTTPSNNATVAVPSVTVKGVTKAGADVSVNEKDTVAGSGGNFSATISLEEGDNYVIVVAVDADGNVAEQELTVTYTPAQ